MGNPRDGGPAFPWDPTVAPMRGMSLRDYFAAEAMNAMGYTLTFFSRDEKSMKEVAASAYRAADAMLQQRDIDVPP